MKRLLLILPLFVGGCALSPVSGLTPQQVAAIPDGRLCLLNRNSPVGFIPLEVQRRELSCFHPKQEEAMLRELAQKEKSSFVGKFIANFPKDLFDDQECRGVFMREEGLTKVQLKGLRLTGEFVVYNSLVGKIVVGNFTDKTIFAHVAVSLDGGGGAQQVLRLDPGEPVTLVVAPLPPQPKEVSVQKCRRF